MTERQANAIVRELVDKAQAARVRNNDLEADALQNLADLLGDEFEAGGSALVPIVGPASVAGTIAAPLAPHEESDGANGQQSNG